MSPAPVHDFATDCQSKAATLKRSRIGAFAIKIPRLKSHQPLRDLLSQ